ncbi:MAG: Flavin-Reduct domain-containing protein [Thermocaproicibacter melissae]|jgi:flavin reductase (DIM6/NTAB) family NADH-FMN oxidoreductase RutF|uniref:flavin reductase family protein n=1 Tax=Thermocaproicibacter melissae TaxID=2966552 RepID=UPI0024B15B82|nr:flavin reductase family protein [Thermocaproicibacter melissae]WBY63832.1 flavin reductase family protein [Thermocaproicibacter melissae]
MNSFKETDLNSLKFNPFTMINDEWMLLTAGNEQKCNTMTVSWGSLGILWNKPVATVYVRPTRYTLEFLEREDTFSLCVLPKDYRAALNYCGTHSGRDGDKIKAAGLTTVYDNGTPYFSEAKLVLVCKKLYKQDFDPACFIDKSLDAANYPKHDYHKMFIGSIEKVLVKE